MLHKVTFVSSVVLFQADIHLLISFQQSCQNTVRVQSGRMQIHKGCKQKEACKSNQIQVNAPIIATGYAPINKTQFSSQKKANLYKAHYFVFNSWILSYIYGQFLFILYT